MYILCVYLHIHAVKNTTICQMVALCNMQHYVVYNYMFRPCKLAIITRWWPTYMAETCSCILHSVAYYIVWHIT